MRRAIAIRLITLLTTVWLTPAAWALNFADFDYTKPVGPVYTIDLPPAYTTPVAIQVIQSLLPDDPCKLSDDVNCGVKLPEPVAADPAPAANDAPAADAVSGDAEQAGNNFIAGDVVEAPPPPVFDPSVPACESGKTWSGTENACITPVIDAPPVVAAADGPPITNATPENPEAPFDGGCSFVKNGAGAKSAWGIPLLIILTGIGVARFTIRRSA